MNDANERRPIAGAASETLGGSDVDSTFDAVSATPEEFIAFLSGYRAGIWQGGDAEIARRADEDRALYQMAVKTVHAMAEIPEHDVLEARRRDYRRPLFVYVTQGERYAVLKGHLRDWLQEHQIPAMWSHAAHGWHVRTERVADVVALAEHDGWHVRVKGGPR